MWNRHATRSVRDRHPNILHHSLTGSMPVTASVDPTYWADPSIVVDTPDGFRQTSPHRALETAESPVFSNSTARQLLSPAQRSCCQGR